MKHSIQEKPKNINRYRIAVRNRIISTCEHLH